MPAGKRLTDGSIEKGVIVANRRIVVTTLEKCILLDVDITAVDISMSGSQIIALASGKLVYLVEISNNRIVGKLGRANGGLHKENITYVKFNPTYTRLATCDRAGRTVIWDPQTQQSEKILDGHKGIVYMAYFNQEGETLYTCAEDGRVILWDWKQAKITGSFIRHKSGCHAFDINEAANPSKLICGQSDGEITSWDLYEKSSIDHVSGDPLLEGNGGHSGAITCLKISPNNSYMATGSTDNTCKLWNISSYSKDFAMVKKEWDEAQRSLEKLDRPIDILDESYDVQLKMNDYFGLKAGQVSFPSGYHADFLFTFKHEASVTDLRFNNSSEYPLTIP